jgi:hypothetical protein
MTPGTVQPGAVFVELTRAYTDEPVWVNPALVVTVEPAGETGHSRLVLAQGCPVDVHGKPHEVVRELTR